MCGAKITFYPQLVGWGTSVTCFCSIPTSHMDTKGIQSAEQTPRIPDQNTAQSSMLRPDA